MKVDVVDMKDSKVRSKFDDRLFGEVYNALGWDRGCVCPYYLEWVRLKSKNKT